VGIFLTRFGFCFGHRKQMLLFLARATYNIKNNEKVPLAIFSWLQKMIHYVVIQRREQ
jgi:hypothetical protein